MSLVDRKIKHRAIVKLEQLCKCIEHGGDE
jgi:hypothetical protein